MKSKSHILASLLVAGTAINGTAMAVETKVESPKKHALVVKHRPQSNTLVERVKHVKKEKSNEGFKLTSAGGLSYVHPGDDNYWFKLSGALRFDETFFAGSYSDKSTDFPSGGNIRAAEVYVDGGLGRDWSYSVTLRLHNSKSLLGETFLSYSGFHPNNQVFLGRVSGNWFGLDNSNSTSWNPFLERSMQALAFYPGDGLGVLTDYWGEKGGITLGLIQPDYDFEGAKGANDRWSAIVRGTFSPVHEAGDVWHFGASAAYREVTGANRPDSKGIKFSSTPSARARNTSTLLDTDSMRANNSRLFNVEFARQVGAFLLETEYTTSLVHRPTLGNVRFNGWNLQSRYMLTGEIHDYDVRDGNFGSVKPSSDTGAIEVAARYDFLNLNDKNVRGGTEHNVTLGVNWYVNSQVKLSANYIRASIHPSLDRAKRTLDIVGVRCQVRFK